MPFVSKAYSQTSTGPSTIDLCLSLFPWADFRTTKGAIKLHVGLNHAGYLPEFVSITEGKVHDVTIGKLLSFPKGSIIAMDKGYNDYNWYKQLTNKGIFFVTRLKKNAKYRVVSRRSVLKDKGLSCDQTIEFTGVQTSKKWGYARLLSYCIKLNSKHASKCRASDREQQFFRSSYRVASSLYDSDRSYKSHEN